MIMISQGSEGAEVAFLQRLLNKHGANPNLDEDGKFGPLTKHAVVTYQTTNTIAPANGIVAKSMWQRLGLRTSYKHRVISLGQQNNTTCWSTAAAMMLGSNMSMGRGNAQVVPGGGLDTGINNVETFIRDLGWRFISRQSAPPATVLISALAHGPLFVALHHPMTDHAVVFNAVFTDGDLSGDGTVFSVCDPYPVGRGSVYGTTYIDQEMVIGSHPAHPRMMIQYVAAR